MLRGLHFGSFPLGCLMALIATRVCAHIAFTATPSALECCWQWQLKHSALFNSKTCSHLVAQHVVAVLHVLHLVEEAWVKGVELRFEVSVLSLHLRVCTRVCVCVCVCVCEKYMCACTNNHACLQSALPPLQRSGCSRRTQLVPTPRPPPALTTLAHAEHEKRAKVHRWRCSSRAQSLPYHRASSFPPPPTSAIATLARAGEGEQAQATACVALPPPPTSAIATLARASSSLKAATAAALLLLPPPWAAPGERGQRNRVGVGVRGWAVRGECRGFGRGRGLRVAHLRSPTRGTCTPAIWKGCRCPSGLRGCRTEGVQVPCRMEVVQVPCRPAGHLHSFSPAPLHSCTRSILQRPACHMPECWARPKRTAPLRPSKATSQQQQAAPPPEAQTDQLLLRAALGRPGEGLV